jgi:pimeloyl-ACP methyl ester carboxylesterase
MPDVTILGMKDGAKIYVEQQGSGQPIVLVHGWSCSSRFWQKNIPALAETFRVVALDLRGHGNSSKILAGHTIGQYARDVREVIEALDLQDVTLVGWSMGGPVVLSYCEQYEQDSRLARLGLVDTAPHPFNAGDWNSHLMKNYQFNNMSSMFKLYTADPVKYVTTFSGNMFKDSGNVPPQDLEWIIAEMTKTPPWIAIAIYSDFLASDYARVLPTVRIPAVVFAANSNVYARGVEMGRHLADCLPDATFVPFEDAGHFLFYEQPEKFNRILAEFIAGHR